jgi:hypothetical protein
MPGPADFSNFAKNAGDPSEFGTSGPYRIRPSDLGEDLDRRRSSECSPFHVFFTGENAGTTLTSGAQYGSLAYNKTAQTYSKIRVCTGSVAPSAVTALQLGVFDVNGNALAQTADQSAVIIAANTVYDNIALQVPIALLLDQPVYLGLGYVGTSLNVLALSLRAQALMIFAQYQNPMSRSRGSGYAGTTLGTLTSSGSTTMPWVELIP